MSLVIANAAKDRVWNQWGAHIPAELQNVAAAEIFNFHATQRPYDIAFAATFIRTFRAANNIGCRAGDTVAAGIAAFVTADARNRDREIHVSPTGMAVEPGMTIHDREALLAHEYIHWLSHRNFYPEFYRVGGDNPFRVEGFTEWLMIECYPPAAVTVVYTTELERTRAWLAADAENQGRLLRFIFAGEATDLTALHP